MEKTLVSIASDALSQLGDLWNTMGVQNEERASYLSQITSDVATMYATCVSRQVDRKSLLDAEIQGLQTTIEDMQVAMDEPVNVPSPNGLCLIPYRDSLEHIRGNLQETWDLRAATLREREGTLFQLYADVGAGIESGFSCTGDRVSLARIAQYDEEIKRVGGIKSERGAEVEGLAAQIKDLWEELGFGPRDEYERSVAQGSFGELGWGTLVISILSAKFQSLSAEKLAREEKIMVMGQGITTLWKRLATPEEEQTAFLEAHAGIGDDVISACEKYLSDKQAEFAVRLVELIGSARNSIESMWKELRLSNAEERALAFPGFFIPASAFSDDLFLSHEAYAASLAATVEEATPVLKAIEKREALLADKIEYEGIIADPHRLIKGSSSARLREEKLERRVKKELPAFNKKLRAMCQEYETAHGGVPFKVNGTRFVDILDAEEAAETKSRGDARAIREARQKGEVEEEQVSGGVAPLHTAPSAPQQLHNSASGIQGTAPPAPSLHPATTTQAAAAPPPIPRATSNPRASVFAPTKSHAAAIAAGAAARAAMKATAKTPAAAVSCSTAQIIEDITATTASTENNNVIAGGKISTSGAASAVTLSGLSVNSRVAARQTGSGKVIAAGNGNNGLRAVGNKALGGPPPVPLAMTSVAPESLAGAEAILQSL